jgi:hypothetical protein
MRGKANNLVEVRFFHLASMEWLRCNPPLTSSQMKGMRNNQRKHMAKAKKTQKKAEKKVEPVAKKPVEPKKKVAGGAKRGKDGKFIPKAGTKKSKPVAKKPVTKKKAKKKATGKK